VCLWPPDVRPCIVVELSLVHRSPMGYQVYLAMVSIVQHKIVTKLSPLAWCEEAPLTVPSLDILRHQKIHVLSDILDHDLCSPL
jgi:hypothetical protein